MKLWTTGIFLWLVLSSFIAQGQFSPDDMAGSLDVARQFNKYPSYEQYVAMMQDFALEYSGICRLDTIGYSEEGRLLLALKISDHVEKEEAEADFFYTSSMHGDETLGFPLLLRLSDYLLKNYGKDEQVSALVDSLAIWINPLANPDGMYRGGNDYIGEATRENARGLDLNRLYPSLLAGEEDDTTGRPAENRHMMVFLRERRFSLSANIHTGAEVVNYPWDWKEERHPDDAWFQLIAREYADEAHSVDPEYLQMFENGVTNGYDWYEVQGSRQDYVTHFLGGREVSLELSFDFIMEAELLEGYWQKNKNSLLYYMTQAGYGIRGRIRDAVTGQALKARIEIPGHDDNTSVVWSGEKHGDFYRLIKGGNYTLLVTAAGYENLSLDVSVGDYEALHLDIELQPLVKSNEAFSASHSLNIYPNPARESCILSSDIFKEGGPVYLRIYSSEGRLVREEIISARGEDFRLNSGGLEPGIYLLNLNTAASKVSTRLLIR